MAFLKYLNMLSENPFNYQTFCAWTHICQHFEMHEGDFLLKFNLLSLFRNAGITKAMEGLCDPTQTKGKFYTRRLVHMY